jgi:hypothetical protein
MFYGPAYWRFIHHFSLHDRGRDLFTELVKFIGCEKCATEYVPPTETENLIFWSLNLHNKINRKLGKWDKWNIDDFNICQKSECDVCSNKVYFGYPWTFIHNVAETGNISSISFLQNFDKTYPCDTCCGTFLKDPPKEGESAIEWTIRNHQKITSNFEYQSNNGCVGCTNNVTSPSPPGQLLDRLDQQGH